MKNSFFKYSLVFAIIANLICILGSVLVFVSAAFFGGSIYNKTTELSADEIVCMEQLAKHISNTAIVYIILTIGIMALCVILISSIKKQNPCRIQILSIFITLLAMIQIVVLFIISGISFLQLFSVPILFFGIFLFVKARRKH